MRVVNYSALARYIKGEVEDVFGEEVDPNTIVTAIMRLSNQFYEPEEQGSQLSDIRINLVTGISEIIISAPPVKHSDIIEKALKLGVFNNYMLGFRQSSTGIRVLAAAHDVLKLREELHEFPVAIKGGYAELHLRIPENITGIEGALTMVIDSLAQQGVHTVDASINQGEISITLREEDAGRAFEILRRFSHHIRSEL